MVTVPIMELRLGESPRLKGEDRAHIIRLTQIERLPPILVERSTMRVIDGFHRLMAASMTGRATIEVEFFDGSPRDAFLLGVEANVTHGLPLSQADRHAAASRILVTHPELSDRALAKLTGLSAKTIAELRRSAGAEAQPEARVGVDGKVRPLSGSKGRLRVAELIAENPGMPLRKVAQLAGMSPATVLDVRRRLERGEEPVPSARRAVEAAPEHPADDGGPDVLAEFAAAEAHLPPAADLAARRRPEPPSATLEKLMRDPSLRQSEQGRLLLRMLRENLAGAANMPDAGSSVPSHWLTMTTRLAAQISQMWSELAGELEKRAKIADPWAGRTAAAAVGTGPLRPPVQLRRSAS